jgi:hypothetical protein
MFLSFVQDIRAIRDSLESYPPKPKMPDVDVASGKLIVDGKAKRKKKLLDRSR